MQVLELTALYRRLALPVVTILLKEATT